MTLFWIKRGLDVFFSIMDFCFFFLVLYLFFVKPLDIENVKIYYSFFFGSYWTLNLEIYVFRKILLLFELKRKFRWHFLRELIFFLERFLLIFNNLETYLVIKSIKKIGMKIYSAIIYGHPILLYREDS